MNLHGTPHQVEIVPWCIVLAELWNLVFVDKRCEFGLRCFVEVWCLVVLWITEFGI